MANQPRTTRTVKKKNTNGSKNGTNNNDLSNTYFDTAYNALSGLTLPQKIGISVSAVALISTAIVMKSKKIRKKNKGKDLDNKPQTMKSFGLGRGRGRGLIRGGLRGAFSGRGRGRGRGTVNTKRKGTKKGDKLEKIPTQQIKQLFQTCLSAKRPQQQLIADKFYEEIMKWSSDQLEIDGQTIIVNFLFWYYRGKNVPETKFYSNQAEHIRYWCSYKTTKNVKWDFYNIKFDYMYSTALLQKSIPHMKKFYQWICSETARPMPTDASSRKPNYYLTRYQAACVLGDWDNGVKMIGQIIKDLSTKPPASSASGAAGASPPASVNPTRNDFFMHYTLRALELPASNPNFGLIFKIVDKLKAEFPDAILPPPVFDSWSILSFRYKNIDKTVKLATIDQDFIFATPKIRDNDGYYKLYPASSTVASRINKKINIWGRVCQMVSPVFGAAGFLPLTGSWSDTKVYMETSWTYRGSGNRLVRKHVIMKIERLPIEKEIESKDYFGKVKQQTGYLWSGHITIYMKKLKQGITLRNLYDDEGEDHFDAQVALKKIKSKNNNDNDDDDNDNKDNSDNNDKTIGNGVNNNNNNDDDDIETQIYEVELVISKDDDAEKDIRKRILTAMNNSSPSTTPR